MKILALDTSSRYGSLALCEQGEVVAEYSTAGLLNQSEHLLPLLRRILSDVQWSLASLDAFAVVLGPGSFTGVRIGIATAQGLSLATGRPAIGISSLHALALGVPYSRYPICPALDARKGELYTALFRWEGGALETIIPEQVSSPSGIADQLEGAVVVVGDGASILTTALGGRSGVQVFRAPGSSSICRASIVAAWAEQQLLTGSVTGLEPLFPLYLRAPEAELKLTRAGEPPAASAERPIT